MNTTEKDKYIKEYLSKLSAETASIIRHRETMYDEIVATVGKKRARFYVQHQIDNGLEERS